MTYLLNNGDLGLQRREHLRGEYEQSAVLLSTLKTRLTWLRREGKGRGGKGRVRKEGRGKIKEK
jgi:hypothetical protein